MSRIPLFVVVLSACAASPELGDRSQSIIGGETASPMDYPTVVALETAPGEWFCTGTLITAEWVLTAAHCVEGAPPAEVKVRFDDANVADTTGGTVADVAEVHSHPEFDWEAWDNDIALLELAAPVTDRTPTALHRDPVAAGLAVLDVGYGVADNNDGGGGLLRKVEKVTADCASANDPSVSGANLVCMDANDGRGSCFGDSGGPAFATIGGQRVVVGVTSGGTGELCGAGWDLYTSIHAELAFLDGVMNAVPPPPPDPPPPPAPEPEPMPADDGGGCNASGGSAGVLVGLLALLSGRGRRSRTRPSLLPRSRRRRV